MGINEVDGSSPQPATELEKRHGAEGQPSMFEPGSTALLDRKPLKLLMFLFATPPPRRARPLSGDCPEQLDEIAGASEMIGAGSSGRRKTARRAPNRSKAAFERRGTPAAIAHIRSRR
jgi:hypothetical protein